MSIANEILRLQQAKSDLATSIENKGVTVPAATTLDGYAALVDQIQQGGSLPYDAEIEYLQFTGTQYINIGYCQTSRNIEIRIGMQWTGNTANQFESFFGYMTNASTLTPRSGLHKYQGKWMLGTNATQPTTNIDGDEHDFLIKGVASANKEELCSPTASLGTAATASTGLSNNTMPYFIGCRNRNGSVDNYAYFRLMSFRLMMFGDSNHTKILYNIELIPVRIGQVGYLYDNVSGQLFGNSGTGNFTLGADKN